ncbi:hypothetical protein KR093_001638, partial [Drosophila rubida]
TAMELPEGILIGFGNPLLDITTTIEDNVILEKYDLAVNAAIIAEDSHLPLFEELSYMENVTFSAGGACQNSMRIFQWIVGKPHCAYFVGAVGKDKFADMIGKRAMADGVQTMYQHKEEAPTGACAVILSGRYRSLVANLGAAALFTEDWLTDEANLCAVERALYVYATGFFIAVNADTVLNVARMTSNSNRTFLLNFSAVFVVQIHKIQLDEIIAFTDVIILNKNEGLAFSDNHNWGTSDIFEIGRRLQALPKDNGRPRIVMITSETCPVLCFMENDKVLEYPVPPINKAAAVDTNGCTDAFVGGFLSQFVQRMPLDYCIRTGLFAYQQVMRIVGVQINKLPNINE